MRNESVTGLLVVEVDNGYLWNRTAENAGDVVDVEDDDDNPPDGVRKSSPVFCGRARVMGGISPSKSNSERKRVDGRRIQATNREI